MIASLGGAGAGLVCGWLVGARVQPAPRWTAAAATAASLLFAIEALALAGWRAAAALLVAVPAGLLIQAGWRAALRNHYLDDESKGSFRA